MLMANLVQNRFRLRRSEITEQMSAHIRLEQVVPIVFVDAESGRGTMGFDERQPRSLNELVDGATRFGSAATAVYALHKFPLQFLDVLRRAFQPLVLLQHRSQFVCESLLSFAF